MKLQFQGEGIEKSASGSGFLSTGLGSKGKARQYYVLRAGNFSWFRQAQCFLFCRTYNKTSQTKPSQV